MIIIRRYKSNSETKNQVKGILMITNLCMQHIEHMLYGRAIYLIIIEFSQNLISSLTFEEKGVCKNLRIS